MAHNKFPLKLLTFVTYIGMVGVNALANILPINGITTGKVADSYLNLFAPAGITFSIWGLIYLLLFIYIIYQFLRKTPEKERSIYEINIYFIISSVANAVWIFTWHYKLIDFSVLLMLVLLTSLIRISRRTNDGSFSFKDRIFVKIPFGIYFGWITIATIANVTTYLVSLGWKDFILPDQTWTVIVLLVGLVIASLTAIKERNLAYGLVPIWAYFGIWIKHTMPTGFNNSYPTVITTVVACMVLLNVSNIALIVRKKAI